MLKRYKPKLKPLDASCGISILVSFISVSANSSNLPEKSEDTELVPLDETHLDVVRRLIELRGFHPSASTSRVCRSDTATSDMD